MDLNIPDKSKYSAGIGKLKDLFSKVVPKATTAVGSVVYELLLRPFSIITESVNESIEKYHADRSLKALSTSNNTTVGAADDVLANYFITRNGGKSSAGVITIYTNSPSMRIPYNTMFTVSNTTVRTDKTVYGIYEGLDSYTNTDTVSYVQSYKVGNKYAFNVPVASVNTVSEVIPSGVAAEPLNYVSGLYSAVLSSAMEGGSSTETDAQMVKRAQSTVCSWYGSSKSIHKLLELSGVPVYGSRSFDASDPEMNRVEGIGKFVGTGGMIDVYVKTAQFPNTGTLSISPTERTIDITDKVPAGILDIVAVLDSSTGNPVDFSVEWGSTRNTVSPEGARYSMFQKATLQISDQVSLPESIVLSYTYMPNIDTLQRHMDQDDIRVLGSSVLVKASAPAVLYIYAKIEPANYTETEINKAITEYVNTTDVGIGSINATDIQEYLASNYPGAKLIHPISMVVKSPRKDGMTYYVNQTSDGVIKSPGDATGATGRTRFFCMAN